MIKTFQIEFVKQALIDFLSHNASDDLYNDEDIKLVSFFEHLQSDEEVNRYVETYKELTEQQNKEHLTGIGIIAVTDSPDITNIKDSFITPFAWGCTVRVSLDDREKMVNTFYDLYGKMKGRTFDIAQYKVIDMFSVEMPRLKLMPTVGRDYDRVTKRPIIQANDYIGNCEVQQIEVVGSGELVDEPFTNSVARRMAELEDKLQNNLVNEDYFYCEYKGTLRKVQLVIFNGHAIYYSRENYGTFEKYSLDLSFEDIGCQSPYTLDTKEYCHITFGGKATLVSGNVVLGNQMCLFAMREHHIDNEAQTSYIQEIGGVDTDLSPLEYIDPAETSGTLATSQITSQLRSSLFMSKTHTDTISPTLQYSFVVDRNKHQVMKLYDYAKWGKRVASVHYNYACVNTVYELHEIYSSWGEYREEVIFAKLTENIPVEVSEADIVSITCNFTIQGNDDYLDYVNEPNIEVR